MPNTCTVSDCDRGAHGQGFCQAHYKRVVVHGDLRSQAPIEDRAPRRGPKPRCVVEICDRVRYARGYCATHYMRWKAGDVQADWPIGAVPGLAERFWAKVTKQPGDGCWLWTGAGGPDSYGRFQVDDQLWLTHRWAWVETHGPVPEGLELDHLCRTPACVRPAHLEPVTHAENIQRGYDARRAD